ncbi:MAG: hypothetical protein IJY85_01170 [Ruminococcus sp.]|nr:hypothetical protein [Ruminococcus sp.]
MERSIHLGMNKSFKLSNVLIRSLDISEKDLNFEAEVLKMENYMKSKGAIPIGPLIQKTSYSINEEGQLNIGVELLRQANTFIHNVEAPYKMEALLRVRNCLYARYIGPEDCLKFAYDKINIAAFEENIELNNDSYTIFVDQHDDSIVADVFVEKK